MHVNLTGKPESLIYGQKKKLLQRTIISVTQEKSIYYERYREQKDKQEVVKLRALPVLQTLL